MSFISDVKNRNKDAKNESMIVSFFKELGFEISWYVTLPFKNLRLLYRALKQFFKQFHLIWDNYDWDFGYFYDMMYEKLKLMKKSFQYGFTEFVMYREKELIYMDIALECLKRITDDDYRDKLNESIRQEREYKFKGKRKNTYVDIDNKLFKESMEMLCDILKRHSRKWWW